MLNRNESDFPGLRRQHISPGKPRSQQLVVSPTICLFETSWACVG